jgi:hypothetical protein
MPAPQISATALPEGPIGAGATTQIIIKRGKGVRWVFGALCLLFLVLSVAQSFRLFGDCGAPHQHEEIIRFALNCAFAGAYGALILTSWTGRGAPLAILDESGAWVSSGGTIPWRRIRACAVRETRKKKTLRFRFGNLLSDHLDIELAKADAGPILAACAAWIAAARASRPRDPALDRIDAQKNDAALGDFVANRRPWPMTVLVIVAISVHTVIFLIILCAVLAALFRWAAPEF